MGMVVLEHLADRAGALAVRLIGIEAQLRHGVQDAPMDRLEAVANVRQGTCHDYAHRVIEVRTAHLVFDVDGQQTVRWRAVLVVLERHIAARFTVAAFAFGRFLRAQIQASPMVMVPTGEDSVCARDAPATRRCRRVLGMTHKRVTMSNAATTVSISLRDEAATRGLGAALATASAPGAVILLRGPL